MYAVWKNIDDVIFVKLSKISSLIRNCLGKLLTYSLGTSLFYKFELLRMIGIVQRCLLERKLKCLRIAVLVHVWFPISLHFFLLFQPPNAKCDVYRCASNTSINVDVIRSEFVFLGTLRKLMIWRCRPLHNTPVIVFLRKYW